ncbi:MAG: hypothetical protein AAFZ52_17480, partial [Bacteroidota bacterium]
QRNWDKSTSLPTFKDDAVHVKVKFKFTGAVLNKSSNAGANVSGLAAAAKSQIEKSFQGKVTKSFWGMKITYDVSANAQIRTISTLSDLNFGKEHLIVILDSSHPKVKGVYGRGPFYGSIIYLNEQYIPDMISGANAKTIPHEAGHTAGLKHLVEKRDEAKPVGAFLKQMHHLLNKDNLMWRGGGHPSYGKTDHRSKLTEVNADQLEQVYRNIDQGKVNQFGFLNFVDLMLLK